MAGSPTTALLISGFRSLILKVGTPTDWNNTKPRSDLIGIKVWCTSTAGFTPSDSTNLVYNGPVTASVVIPNLDIYKTYYVRYAFISSIDPATYTYSKEYSGTVYDENTSIYGFLSNDPINVPSEVLGVNPDFTNATGVFKMFSFSQDITGAGPTYGIKASSQTGGIVATIDSITGIYAVTGLTSDTGSITFTASYTNAWATLTVERTLMVSKSKQGYSAAFFSIDNSAVTFKRAVDTTITPTNIILTTSAQNIINPTYKWYKQTNSTGTFNLISGATNSSYTVANTDYSSTIVTNTYKCEVTGKINNTVNQTLVDQITIPLLIDSSSAISITNSNENITFAAPVFGYTGINFAGSSSQIRAYIGTEQLTYATTGAKTFDCTIAASGVTVTSSGSGNVFTVSEPTAMSTDTATVTVTINIRDAASTLTTLNTIISYSLARTGFYAGLFSIQNSAVTFKKSVDTTISPASITLNTAAQNIDSGSESYKWYKQTNGTGTFNLISGATSSSYVVANTEYSSAITNTYRAELTCRINNITTVLTDQITIPLLIDASSAITITNSNESITFAGAAFGYTGIDFSNSSAQIRAYIGTEQLNYATSGAKTFSCIILSTSGITVSGSGSGNVFTVGEPTAMTSDTANAIIEVSIRDAASVVTTLTSTISYSLSRRGYKGVSSRTAYTKTSLISLSSTPTTITTTGNISFPADGSWGAGTVWQDTPPTIAADESVYQTDGFYDVVTDSTTWNVPYLSTLKVGSLSAITANTGDLTVTGNFTAGTAAISGTTMTGAGGVIDKDGHFAFGNTSTNITYNGGSLYLNGDVVTSGNIKTGAVTLDKLDIGAAFPTGGIIAWYGSLTSIPAGWALCDGTNGTPDLRDRFVVGTGTTYTQGSNGNIGYTLPTATTSTLGAVKVGSGLSIDGSGVLSATSTTPQLQTFTSSGTFTVPTGITSLKVLVVGGGAGGWCGGNAGTGATVACYCVPSPGRGGSALKTLTGLTPGATLTITVGAGGILRATNTYKLGTILAGTDGGNSSVSGTGFTTVQANGGQGVAKQYSNYQAAGTTSGGDSTTGMADAAQIVAQGGYGQAGGAFDNEIGLGTKADGKPGVVIIQY